MINWVRKDGDQYIPRDPEKDEWVRILNEESDIEYSDYGDETQIETIYYEVQA